jgi:hypothetical protein
MESGPAGRYRVKDPFPQLARYRAASSRFFHLSNPVEPLQNLSHPLAGSVQLSTGGSKASSRGTFNGNPAIIGDPVPLGCKLL